MQHARRGIHGLSVSCAFQLRHVLLKAHVAIEVMCHATTRCTDSDCNTARNGPRECT